MTALAISMMIETKTEEEYVREKSRSGSETVVRRRRATLPNKSRSPLGHWKQTKGRLRRRAVEPGKEGKFYAPEVLRLCSSTSLDFPDGRFALYLKGVFSLNEMQNLASRLDGKYRLLSYLEILTPFPLEAEGWEYKKDLNRGKKDFYIIGDWTAQGHNRPGIDCTFAAGAAGKLERQTGTGLSNFLNDFYACKASEVLRYALGKRAPHLLSTLDGKKRVYLSKFLHLIRNHFSWG